jgi:integral membrane sensor domain MASE1
MQDNNQRTIGIIATTVTGLLCGCSGLFLCVFGALAASGSLPYNLDINNGSQTGTTPAWIGIVLICLALIFVAIPVLVGFFTLRKRPAPPAGGAVSYPAPNDPNQPGL